MVPSNKQRKFEKHSLRQSLVNNLKQTVMMEINAYKQTVTNTLYIIKQNFMAREKTNFPSESGVKRKTCP